MIIDSHCHLVSHRFAESEIGDIIDRAKQAGVTQMVTLATSLDDCPKHLALAHTFPSVLATAGIHPCDVHQAPDNFSTALQPYLADPKCVAVGETGLDYFHPAPDGWTEQDYHQRQRRFLDQHFALAAEHKLNIVLHTRDRSGRQSMLDCLDIYRPWADRVRAVFHCFLGPAENAKAIYDLGGIVSFTGITTFKKADETLAAASQAPVGSFMLETDSPYLAPTPFRGKRCEPAYVRITAEHIAAARSESLESLAQHTTQTAREFYKI